MFETHLHELARLILVLAGERFKSAGGKVLNQDAEFGASLVGSLSHGLHFLVLENLAVCFLEQFFLIFATDGLGVLIFPGANASGRGSSFLKRRFTVRVLRTSRMLPTHGLLDCISGERVGSWAYHSGLVRYPFRL